MDNYQLLDLIRRRPAMYIGRHCTSHLRSFLVGYSFCAYTNKLVIPAETPDFGGFHDWVAEKLGYSESTSGWSNMIAGQRSDSETALWLFFQLLDEYRGLQPHKLASVVYQQNLTPNPDLYHFHNYTRTGKVILSEKARPYILTVEKVLPDQDWIALYAKKGDVILARWPFDTLEKALQHAQKVFGVDAKKWEIVVKD
jgi:hypothetical protein